MGFDDRTCRTFMLKTLGKSFSLQIMMFLQVLKNNRVCLRKIV